MSSKSWPTVTMILCFPRSQHRLNIPDVWTEGAVAARHSFRVVGSHAASPGNTVLPFIARALDDWSHPVSQGDAPSVSRTDGLKSRIDCVVPHLERIVSSRCGEWMRVHDRGFQANAGDAS